MIKVTQLEDLQQDIVNSRNHNNRSSSNKYGPANDNILKKLSNEEIKHID